MVNVAFDTLSPEIRSMLMNADQANVCQQPSPCETKTLVYVNQPYIALKEAKVLRRLLMTISGASQAVWATVFSAWPRWCRKQLAHRGLPVSLDINEGIHDAQRDTTLSTILILLVVMSYSSAVP